MGTYDPTTTNTPESIAPYMNEPSLPREKRLRGCGDIWHPVAPFTNMV